MKIYDINTGMRVIKVSSYCNLLEAMGMDLEAEMCCKAVKNNLKISQIAIDYKTERTGDSKVRPGDFFLILFRIAREKWSN